MNYELKIDIIEDKLVITKNGDNVVEIPIIDKTLSLSSFYDNMKISVDDNYSLSNKLKKYEKPIDDKQRIFNNIYDFLNELIQPLNNKLAELKDKKDKEDKEVEI